MTERLFYVNLDGCPVTFERLDAHITDIASGAQGLMDFIDDTLKRFETSEELNYRLGLMKAAAGYIRYLSCDRLLPDIETTENEYAEFGRVVRRGCDGTPIDVEPAPGDGRGKKGGGK